MSAAIEQRSYVKGQAKRGEASKPHALLGIGAVLLAVLAYAGQIKTLPFLAWVPVDLTFLSGVAVASCVLLALFRRPWVDLRIFWVLGLWVLFLLPVALSADTGYGVQKVVTLFSFTLLCTVAPFFLLRGEPEQQFFLGALVVSAVVFSVVSLSGGILDSYAGSVIEGLNPIGSARVMASGAAVLLFYGLTGRGSTRWLWLVGAAAIGLLLFASGRRGPIVALVIAVAVVVAFAPTFRRRRGRSILLTVLAGVAAIWTVLRTDPVGANRIFDLLGGGGDASTAAREYMWGQSLELIARHPLGIGWAQFPQAAEVDVMTSTEGRMYPHNLFLEAFLEAGWLAGLALLVFVAVACARAVRGATSGTGAAFLGLLIFSLVNAMVSGDVNDQKLLWVALAVAMMTKASATHEKAATLSGVR